MASKFSLEATLSLVDDITRPYKKTTNKIVGLNDRLGNSFRSLGTGITRSLKMGAAVGVAALGAGLVVATKEFIAMEGAVTAAAAKFQDIDVTADNFNDKLKELQQSARAVGRDTKFSATDAAGALDKFAMAGLDSSQAMELLRGTTDLAVVANTDLTTAVDIATDTLGAFGLEANKLNLDRVSDTMAKTTVMANTSLEELFESIGKGGAVFANSGQDIETFSALAGAMADATIKGGESGTSLRNVMLRLAKPTGEAADLLDELGIKTSDTEGNFRDVIDILADFEKGLKGMGSQQRTAALSTIFGARTITGISVLLEKGSESLRDFREELKGSSGDTRTMADVINKSLGNRLLAMKSALIEMGFTFVEVFADKAGPTLDRLTDGIKNIDLSSLAIRFDSFITKILDNMPAIKQAFIDFLPAIKDIANQVAMILGFLVEGIAKITAFTAGPVFTAIDFLLPGGQMRVAERKLAAKKAEEEAERERVSSQNPRYLDQQTAIQQSRIFEEKTQRMDLFFNMPNNSSVSDVPGGAPVNSLQLGAQ
jgi:TP901 family phage tail tape measure protein